MFHRFWNYRALTGIIALGLMLNFAATASYAGNSKAKTAVKTKALAAAIDPCRLLTKADAKKVLGAPVKDAMIYHDVGVPGTRCSYFTSAPIAEAGGTGVVSVEVYDIATFKRKGSYFKSPENYFYRSRDTSMSTNHHGIKDVSAVGEAAFWQPGPGLLNVLDRGVYLILSVHANFHIPLGPGHRETRSTSTQPREDTAMKPHVKLRFPVSTLAALALSLAALPTLAAPTTAVARGIGLAPAGLVATIARTQAPEAAQNPAYAIGNNGCAQLGERNNAPVLAGCFGRSGPAFSIGKQTLRLQLSAWGRAGQLRPVTLKRTALEANRIAYRGRHLTEWWRVLPLGYEQGFTLDQAPAGTGKVVLQLSASRAPKIAHGTLAWGPLRYGKLHVTDAAGHVLPATLSAHGKTITLAFDAAQARYPVTVDPLVWVQQEVTAVNGAGGDNFGTSVTLSANGTTALVGTPYKTVGSNNSQGTVYVYTFAGGTWSQTAELTASNGTANDQFGSSVALSSTGTTALVGAWGKTVGGKIYQGAVYVYTLAGGTWSQAAELTASDGGTNDSFGSSVALSANGTTALVGAYYKNIGTNNAQGAAYVYTASNGAWNQVAELTASNGAANDNFGLSVALSGDGATALVGVFGSNAFQGTAYVYTLAGGIWSQAAELTASNGAANDTFGLSVALSANGTTALVGATGKGAAYVYIRPAGGWATTSTFAAELTASDGAGSDNFGTSVALSANGTTALVGAYFKTVSGNSTQGAAYVYTLTGGTWSQAAELTAANGAASDEFGNSVALSSAGTTALVGTENKTVGGNSYQGAAYFFGSSDLSAVLSAPATVVPGGRFDSQYILTNNSSSASADIQVALQAPASGADMVAVSSTGPNGVFGCILNSITQLVTCDLGSIPGNGGNGSATLTLQATGAVGSSIAQSAQLAGGVSLSLVQNATTTINHSAPIASNLTLSTYAGQALSGTLPAVVIPSSDTLTYAIVSQPTHGAVTVNAAGGAFTYTPASGYSGPDSFTFTATDTVTGLVSNIATVAITINPTPPPGQVAPVASNLTLTTYTNQALSGTLPAVVTPSSDTLSYAIAGQPTHGKVTVKATTGAFTYTPASGYSGSDSFTFTAKDTVTGLTSNTATVAITTKVTPPSPTPGGGSGGGGTIGPLALLGLLLLALVPWWLRCRGFRSTSTQPTEDTAMKPRRAHDSIGLNLQDTQLREDIPMKPHVKLRFLVSTLAALALSLAALPAFATTTTPGHIDTNFNNGGTPAIIDMNTSGVTIKPYAAAMNPLTKDILWAGYYVNSTTQGGAITAYTSAGTADPNFGNSGGINLTADQAGSNFTGGGLKLYAIAVDGQGRILATGEVWNATTTDMVLARFKPGGALDISFGAAGTGIVVAPLNTWAAGTGLSLTADGHILVTGEAYNAAGTTYPLTVWRFKSDGTPDTAFGNNGLVQIAAVDDFSGFWCFPALQPDGALIAGCDKGTAASWKLTRLKADGSVDTGFGTSGYLTGSAGLTLTGLALAPDGGFVISELPTTSPYLIDMRRFLADGTVDPSFNNNGNPLSVSTLSSRVAQVPVAVQPDGKILLSSNDGGYGLFIGRFLANGTLDSGFGNSVIPGLSDIPFTSIGGYNYTPNAAALLLQGDGKIVASGWADSTAGSKDAGFVTRVLSDTYDLMPTAPAFNDVAHAPLGQAIASNAVTVSGVSIGSATNGFRLALVTQNGKYSTSGTPFAGSFTATNVAWAPAGSSLALEQMTPPTGGTATTTTVVLGGFWAANNYEVPLGSPATANWTTTTDQPPVASDGTLSATTARATAGTLSATNPSSGTLAFSIVTAPAHGTATLTNAAIGAYSYTSTAGYTGNDTFTWKVNDGVADSNMATEGVTVKAAPSSGGGGGGGLGLFALLGLLLLGLSAHVRRPRVIN